MTDYSTFAAVQRQSLRQIAQADAILKYWAENECLDFPVTGCHMGCLCAWQRPNSNEPVVIGH